MGEPVLESVIMVLLHFATLLMIHPTYLAQVNPEPSHWNGHPPASVRCSLLTEGRKGRSDVVRVRQSIIWI